MDVLVSWDEAANAFCASKKSGKEENTARFYRTQVNQLLQYLEALRKGKVILDNKDYKAEKYVPLSKWQCRHMDIYGIARQEGWTSVIDGAERHYKPVSRSTWRHDVIAIREFLDYVKRAFEELEWARSPIKDYELPVVGKPFVKMPTDEELNAVLAAIPVRQDKRLNPNMAGRPDLECKRLKIRDTAWINLLISSIARIGELLELNMKDYNQATHELTFRDTKGDVARTVTIEPEAAALLKEWLDVRDEIKRVKNRHGQSLINTERIFISLTGAPLYLRAAERRFEHYREFAGQEGWSLHGVRHWGATTLIDKTDSVETAQVVMGHKNVSTTHGYDHRKEKRAGQKHQQAGLLAGLQAQQVKDRRYGKRPNAMTAK